MQIDNFIQILHYIIKSIIGERPLSQILTFKLTFKWTCLFTNLHSCDILDLFENTTYKYYCFLGGEGRYFVTYFVLSCTNTNYDKIYALVLFPV